MRPRRLRGEVIWVAAAIAAACALAPRPACAGPTVWSRARDPRVSVQDELVRDAQRAVRRYQHLLVAEGPQAASLAALLLRDVRLTLARVVASGATDFGVRLLH